MDIYVVRHAYAYEHGDPRWPDDSQRPLAPEGVDRFTKMIEVLAPRGFEPHVIATSPYLRCRQTADIIAAGVTTKPDIVEFDALTPGSDFEALVEWSRKFVHGESIAWVGHAPDVSWLTSRLIGDGEGMIRFAKGAIAAIRVPFEIEEGGGQLSWLATAKLLGIEKPVAASDD
jgi:phosphohistidine phosphatase